MLCSTSAIVLNNRQFSDTSLICNLYSTDYGKFSIIAKGVRSLKNPYGAVLQPLNYIDLVYYYKEKRNIQLFKEGSIIKKYYNISNDYQKLVYSLTMSDMINFTSYNDSPCHIIFRLITKSLELIDDTNIKFLDYYYIFFNIQLLIYLGYYPILETCYGCNNILKSASFDDSAGQLICMKCSKKKESISSDAIELIHLLSKTHISKINKYFIHSNKNLEIIKNYLRKFILYHIPELKSSKAFISLNK